MSISSDSVLKEKQRRENQWNRLLSEGGPTGVPPRLLRSLGIYGGASGVWFDKDVTGDVGPDGITVGVLHTNSDYPDDLSTDGIIYHYPVTDRPPGRDAAEIRATKAAGELQLPIFVITRPTPSSSIRNVYRGWVEGWDDASKQFLIIFDDKPPATLITQPDDEAPFQMTTSKGPHKATTEQRPDQQRFRFLVFQRYGPRCALCDVDIPGLLDAAHIVPKSAKGSDDPRNGLVLCALHHRVLDEGYIGVDSVTRKIGIKTDGPSSLELHISESSIDHLPLLPHPSVLQWHWEKVFDG